MSPVSVILLLMYLGYMAAYIGLSDDKKKAGTHLLLTIAAGLWIMALVKAYS